MSAVQDHAGQAGWGAGGQAEVKMGGEGQAVWPGTAI